ncbi:membrane transporter [Coprinopsis cinerea AmutBmut pab1-1]|nr:membrane transporter [Coprinopsis cinerea AmutBmut pab1-1]
MVENEHHNDKERKDLSTISHDSASVPGGAEGRRYETIYDEGTIDLRYLTKARILNDAIQDIGMGRYQWGLFIVTGFGWFADNLWPIVTGLIIPPTVNEFNYEPPFLKLGQNIGLLLGAAFWGVAADVWGRKISFNITLLIVGIFALAAGGSHDFVTLTSLAAVWSIGVGGNLPVDSALFLEFIPASHQYLLTILSIWWAFGQLIGSLVAWPLIKHYSCETETPGENCPRSSNMGWRYFMFAMGGLMLLWGIRFFVFKLYESPKFLMGQGKHDKAVDVIHNLARHNGTSSRISVEDLARVAASPVSEKEENGPASNRHTTASVIKRHLSKFDAHHLKALFASRRLAWSTSLLILLWALIGLAFPLYNSFVTYYLSTRGADFGDGSIDITYRNASLFRYFVSS